jgi:hypothetical protein
MRAWRVSLALHRTKQTIAPCLAETRSATLALISAGCAGLNAIPHRVTHPTLARAACIVRNTAIASADDIAADIVADQLAKHPRASSRGHATRGGPQLVQPNRKPPSRETGSGLRLVASPRTHQIRMGNSTHRQARLSGIGKCANRVMARNIGRLLPTIAYRRPIPAG